MTPETPSEGQLLSTRSVSRFRFVVRRRYVEKTTGTPAPARGNVQISAQEQNQLEIDNVRAKPTRLGYD